MPEATLFIILTTSFIVGLSGAMMPGPLLTLAISQAARRGFWTGPALVLGHGIVEVALIIALTAGLSRLLERGAVAGAIGLVGGAVLIWMSWGIIRAAPRQAIPLHNPSPRASPASMPVVAGAVASLANPYWIIWWATIGATYVLWSLSQGPVGVVSFYTGHILADLGWYSLVAAIIATGRKLMGDRLYRGLLVACGVFLIGLGAYFMVSGIQSLSTMAS